VAPAEQEITCCPNQSGRTDTNARHFIGSHAVVFAVMCKRAMGSENNNQAGQHQEFFQG